MHFDTFHEYHFHCKCFIFWDIRGFILNSSSRNSAGKHYRQNDWAFFHNIHSCLHFIRLFNCISSAFSDVKFLNLIAMVTKLMFCDDRFLNCICLISNICFVMLGFSIRSVLINQHWQELSIFGELALAFSSAKTSGFFAGFFLKINFYLLLFDIVQYLTMQAIVIY